jgi:hypothetical protein
MCTQEETNLDKLIAVEWDIMHELLKMFSTDLSPGEKTRVANALAYHAIVLNKLLSQKGENSQFDDATLGDFIRGVDHRMRTRIKRDYRVWQRRLSLKK